MTLNEEISRRRTFAVIAHPDAGKTTLTEKLLLFGGAIHVAGAVKSNKIKKGATSDFMEIERQRGISVATSVMGFNYKDVKINILDTPGHEDFAEDTYRTLTAVDSVIIVIDGVRILVPARHTGLPMNADLATLVGKTEQVKIIDINDSRRHAYASIKAPKIEAKKALEEAFWANIEEGKHYTGKVKSMTTFGAFVDLGGVDGMVHNTELSWKRIKHPSEVVAIGDEIDVWVKEFDAERKRISLGYKTPEMNSWYIFVNKYQIDDVVPVKIVSMMPFGAFAEIIDGTDGLIHISQIADRKISKPADVLEIGQVVDAKIIDIDTEKQKVSLSIRALLADQDEDVEDVADEAEAVEAEAEAEAEVVADAE